MKSLKTAFLSLLVASPSFAGGLSAPIIEPEIIEEDTTNSSRAGILVPILAILLIGLAISSGGNDSAPPPE